jgi:hypothetical protein
MPGTTAVTPSVLKMARSASGVSASVSVALLLVRSGSSVPIGAVTVAVVTRAPVADGSTLTWKKKETLSPFASSGGRQGAGAVGRAGDAAGAAAVEERP